MSRPKTSRDPNQCAICSLDLNYKSERPQLISCQTRIGQVCPRKCHLECHFPVIDKKEYVETIRYCNGNFWWYCPKCNGDEVDVDPARPYIPAANVIQPPTTDLQSTVDPGMSSSQPSSSRMTRSAAKQQQSGFASSSQPAPANVAATTTRQSCKPRPTSKRQRTAPSSATESSSQPAPIVMETATRQPRKRTLATTSGTSSQPVSKRARACPEASKGTEPSSLHPVSNKRQRRKVPAATAVPKTTRPNRKAAKITVQVTSASAVPVHLPVGAQAIPSTARRGLLASTPLEGEMPFTFRRSITLVLTPTDGRPPITVVITPTESEPATGLIPGQLALPWYPQEGANEVPMVFPSTTDHGFHELSSRNINPVPVKESNTVLPNRPVPRPNQLALPSFPQQGTERRWSRIEGALKSGGPAIYDGLGYKYSQHREPTFAKDRKTKEVVAKFQRWRCTSRNGEKECKGAARAIEEPPGAAPVYELLSDHNICAPEPGIEFKDALYVEAKKLGREQLNRPALEFIQPLLVKFHEQHPSARIPAPTNLERVVNSDRKPERPKVPTDLYFDINELIPGFPPGFYRDQVVFDVGAVRHRHLIFATDDQLSILRDLKRWYLDGTYFLCPDPFHQLFTIHGFITYEGLLKQVPLVSILMSHRSFEDYFYVFQKIKEILKKGQPADFELPIVEVVSDFEEAIIKGARHSFVGYGFLEDPILDEKEEPKLAIMGCGFHWTQCVFRRIAELGCAIEYRNNPEFKQTCRKVLALNHLPYDKIEGVVSTLRTTAPEPLIPLFDYLNTQWLENINTRPKRWSVFQQETRTNNDTEGWHRRMNAKFTVKPDLFKCVYALWEEAKLLPVQVRLLQQGTNTRRESPLTLQVNERLSELWAQYRNHDLTTMDLLERCSTVYFEDFREDLSYIASKDATMSELLTSLY